MKGKEGAEGGERLGKVEGRDRQGRDGKGEGGSGRGSVAGEIGRKG